MLDYANIISAGRQLVPNLREQLMQDALVEQQQTRFQLEQEALQHKLAEQEEAKRRQAEFGSALEAALVSNDPRDLVNLRLRYPEFAEGLSGAFDALDEQNKRDILTSLGTVYARGQAGDYEGAVAAMRERVEADRAAGTLDPQDELLLAELDYPNEARRNGALATIGITLAALEPDKFAENYGKMQKPDSSSAFAKEYNDRVRLFGKDAADAWARTNDVKLVPVQPGGTVFEFDGGLSGGGDPSGSRGGVTPVSEYNMKRRAEGDAAAAAWAKGRVFTVSSPEIARMLPSGTQIILPDGSPGVVP